MTAWAGARHGLVQEERAEEVAGELLVLFLQALTLEALLLGYAVSSGAGWRESLATVVRESKWLAGESSLLSIVRPGRAITSSIS